MGEMNLSLNYLAAIIFGVLAFYVCIRIFYLPLKMLLRVFSKAIVGGAFLALFNFIGAIWGLTIGLNVITILIVGFLGIPGIIMLLVLQHMTG